MYPQIYLGHIPPAARERHALRERAFDLHACLSPMRHPEPTYVLLNFAAGDESSAQQVELLLLRPNAAIVGAIREYPHPIDVLPDGRWLRRDSDVAIQDERGRTPMELVKEQRDAVRDRLNQAAGWLLDVSDDTRPFERVIGALICAPTTHPESRISLDVNQHRQWLKVLGLDELAGLAAMAKVGVCLSEQAMQVIASEIFASRLWHDGTQLLFELAVSRFQLRMLVEGGGEAAVLPLSEGENVVGRRRTAQRHEHRLTLTGDDLISSDHVRIICGDDDRVILCDTSKNGTWVTPPDKQEEHLQGGERVIDPGTLLRVGVTRMRLERITD